MSEMSLSKTPVLKVFLSLGTHFIPFFKKVTCKKPQARRVIKNYTLGVFCDKLLHFTVATRHLLRFYFFGYLRKSSCDVS